MSDVCQCREGDWCVHLGRYLVGRVWQLARDETPLGEAFRRRWADGVAVDPRLSIPRPPLSCFRPVSEQGVALSAEQRLRTPCRHLGEATGETVECPSCSGRVRVKVLGCGVFGRCTAARDVGDGTACCLTCKQYEAAAVTGCGCAGGLCDSVAEGADVKRPVKWATGVTTVPERRRDLLPRTLGSLRLAGFGQPRLFVDGITDAEAGAYAAEFLLPVTARWPRISAWGNWALGMTELLIREPAAQRFAMFQDDLACCRNLRQYLDGMPYSPKTYWSLYTAPQNEALAAGRRGFYPSNQYGRGALALVFSREAVVDLLGHPDTASRPLAAARAHSNIDGWVLTVLKKQGYTELVHAPSLVQHTGDTSTLAHPAGQRCGTFPGETFDATELLGGGAAPAVVATAETVPPEEIARVRAALAADEERLRTATGAQRASILAHVRRYNALLAGAKGAR